MRSVDRSARYDAPVAFYLGLIASRARGKGGPVRAKLNQKKLREASSCRFFSVEASGTRFSLTRVQLRISLSVHQAVPPLHPSFESPDWPMSHCLQSKVITPSEASVEAAYQKKNTITLSMLPEAIEMLAV